MGNVTLCAVSLSGADGVAAVSRMLSAVMRVHWPDEYGAVTLLLGPSERASIARKATFAGTMAASQLLCRTRWTLFTHANLLRVQSIVPPRRRRPYAVFLHGIEAWGELSSRDLHLLAGARLRLANSTFTARRVMAAHPEIGPVIACPLALPQGAAGTVARPSEANAIGNEAVPDVGPAGVLIVGRMLAAERYKGHDQLIDAWPRIREAVPNARLFVVGKGDDLRRLRARAARAGLGESVVFPGFVSASTLATLYERCQLFAMPSRGEGFGLVYLEAMSHGLPCIGSRQDAAAEVIEDEQTGFLVDQDDVPALADRIVRLLTDRDLCARMGEAGRRRVREAFSFERFERQVVGCLRTAFEGAEEPVPGAGAGA